LNYTGTGWTNTQSMGQSGFEKASTAVTANYEMKRAWQEENRHQKRLKAFVSESISNL
jgi:hypothetical protein